VIGRMALKKSAWDWALTFYESWIIVLGLLVSVLVVTTLIRYEQNLPVTLYALGLVILYGVMDRRPLSFRGIEVSLSFPVILVALLLWATRFSAIPDVAVLTATGIAGLGSLLSESLRRLSRPRLPLDRSVVRVLFYAAHHALAGITSAQAYLKVSSLGWGQGLEDLYIEPALVYTLVYALVYSLVSQVIVWPHDVAVSRLMLPTDEKRLPRVDLLTLVAIVPIPLVLFYLFSGEADWAFVVVFLLFLAFLVGIGSYAKIDVAGRRLQAREDLRRKLGAPVNMSELRQAVYNILGEELDYQWGAIYSAEVSSDVYRLRGSLEKAEEGARIVAYDPPFSKDTGRVLANEALPPDQAVHWPRLVTREEGLHLGEVVRTGEPSPNIGGKGEQPAFDSDPYLPPRVVAMYVPVQYETAQHGRTTIGLLALTRSAKQFKEGDRVRVESLAEAMSGFLQQIRQFEDQLQHLYEQAKDYTRNPGRLQRAMQHLHQAHVDVFLILNLISQSAFRSNLRSVLQSVIERARGKVTEEDVISLPEDVLCEIYDEARRKRPDMPPLDDEILENLKVLPSSLEQAFSFRYQWPEISRGPEFIRLYEFFDRAMEARSVFGIIKLRSKEPDATIKALGDNPRFNHPQIIEHLKALTAIVDLLKRGSLVEAMNQAEELNRSVDEHIADPERFIFRTLLDNWHTIIYTTFAEREGAAQMGEAQVDVSLRCDHAFPLQPLTVGLRLENRGPGTAFQVGVKMLQAADYRVIGKPEARLGSLPPMGKRELEFTVEPVGNHELKVQFQIVYRDLEQKQMPFEGTLYLREPPPSFTFIPHPYVPGKPLSMNSSVFFGRRDIFEFINQNMSASASQQRILLLIGERRIGKTSVLKQLPARVEDKRYIHAFCDCQAIGGVPNVAGFFRHLTTVICSALKREGFLVERPPDDDLRRDAHSVFEQRFLPKVWEKIGDRRLLIAVDEFERLAGYVREGKMSEEDLAAPLRALMQSQDRMAFIFAGTHQLEALFSEYWGVLFNMAQHWTIGFLNAEDTRRLITEPVREYRVYDDLALDEMLRASGGHPFFLQVMCVHVMNTCHAERRSYVTVQDARNASREVVSAGRTHLGFVWSESDPIEQDALAGLAKSLALDPQATVETIAGHLEKAGRRRTRPEVRDALQRLETRRHIVTREQGPGETGYYDFAAGLYRLWIQKSHALD
jgi:hypothetical protein